MSQETQRRWKASIVFGLIGVLFGILVTLAIILFLSFEGWQKTGQNISSLIAPGMLFFVSLCCCINLPIFVIVTLGSYYQFMISNDVLIDAIWKNSKVKS